MRRWVTIALTMAIAIVVSWGSPSPAKAQQQPITAEDILANSIAMLAKENAQLRARVAQMEQAMVQMQSEIAKSKGDTNKEQTR